MGDREFSAEQIAKGEQITRYYEELDETDPANQPTDDETKTIPPIRSIIGEDEEK